jgi:hypothetical protein
MEIVKSVAVIIGLVALFGLAVLVQGWMQSDCRNKYTSICNSNKSGDGLPFSV